MFATIVISVLLVAVVVLILFSMRKKKRQGKSSCGCGCSDCAMSQICHRSLDCILDVLQSKGTARVFGKV